MTPRSAIRPTRAAGAVLAVFLAGCTIWPFPMGSEPDQTKSARSFVHVLSLSNNKIFGVFLKELSSLMALGLPTRYGLDVSPYFQVFPSVMIGAPASQPLFQPDSRKELTRISAGSQLLINVSSVMSGQNSCTYTLGLVQSPLGTQGTLVVSTSGSNWQQPAGANNATYFLNQNKVPLVPSMLDAQLDLKNLPQGSGQAQMTASLASFEQSGDAPLPRSVNLGLQLSNLKATLSGGFGSLHALSLQGSTQIKTDKGYDAYTTQLTCTATSTRGTFTCDAQKVKADLTYEKGLFTGTIRAIDGRQATLATVTQLAGKNPDVRYADGTNEIWSFTVPN